MRRASILAAALAAASAGCGNRSTPSATGQLRQPSAVAAFVGLTVANPGALAPFVAVANTDRNDLTLVNAVDDSVVKAPVLLRPLAVPVDSPALLASASLGDVPTPEVPRKPDLLVVVAAGDSTLQVVRTWAPDNGVAATVDLPGDVLALAAIPSPAGTARLAVALSGRRLAVVQFQRAATGEKIAIEAGPAAPRVHALGFDAVSLATVPGDATHVYAASLEPIGPSAVLGAAEIDVSADVEPWPVRGLGARGATRLVAAAALHAERKDAATEPTVDAFAGQPPVARVYAVLDEGSCGPDRPIPCGLVALDPALDTATRGHSIPDDFPSASGERWMPYRAPIPLGGRPLALAVSQPPQLPPPESPDLHGGFMRLLAGTNEWATTAVGIAATSAGAIQILDLGRFRHASTVSVPKTANPSVAALPTADNRLWLQTLDQTPPHFVEPFAVDAGAAAVQVTPGYEQDESWSITYQGGLPGLAERLAEAGSEGADTWLAVQVGGPGPIGAARPVAQVARLFHPALGVHVGDILSIRAAGIGAPCEGTIPPGTPAASEATAPRQFEVTITALRPPDATAPGGAACSRNTCRPGGFVTIGPREFDPGELTAPAKQDAWNACLGALQTKIAAAPGNVVTGLVVSFHARELVLTGAALGYAGRPAFHVPYAIQYRASLADPDEDALAATCPLADWDGTLPAPTCGGTCDRDVCEQLVLARKARRVEHLAEDCAGDAACLTRFPVGSYPFPTVNGPAIRFQVDQQVVNGASADRVRGALQLRLGTSSGSLPMSTGGGSVALPGGATTFDRSPWGPDGSGGYRFYVSYPGGEVVDAYPGVSPLSTTVIR